MPTYRNDGKNVLLVERVDGVVVPVGPGESVETFKTITVEGFTETAASPAAATIYREGKKTIYSITVSGERTDPEVDEDVEILIPSAQITRHQVFVKSALTDGRGELHGMVLGTDVYGRISDLYHISGFKLLFSGIFSKVKFTPPDELHTFTVNYLGWIE